MSTTLPQTNDFGGTPLVSLQVITDAIRANGTDCEIAGDASTEIRGVAIDSRKAAARCLFICKGAGFKPAFLESAIANGAAAYLCQGELDERGKLTAPVDLAAAAAGAPAIVTADVRRAMAIASKVAYGDPSAALNIVGITGTKGKTTTSYMLHAIMDAAQVSTSILGSIETDDGIEEFESCNTTPESPDLWRHLSNTVASGRAHMVMEVSSQALKYDRVLGLTLNIACFLNIGRDHISPAEHPTFEDYFESKLRIFDQCECAVVNLGTEHADEVMAAAKDAPQLFTIGVDCDSADLAASNVHTVKGGIEFDIEESAKLAAAAGEADASTSAHTVKLSIAGLFNAENALCAIACARLLGIGWNAIEQGLSHVRVPGRMEIIASPNEPITAIVDYAHNKLSFETLFKSLKKEYPGQQIIAIFGAPGGKAYERREVLPQTAGAYADLLIYAEEDPAHDRVEDICAELASNTPEGVAHEIIYDREEAFKRAVEVAHESGKPTVIAFLAKGEEELQHRGDNFEPIKSDSAIAHEILGA